MDKGTSINILLNSLWWKHMAT